MKRFERFFRTDPLTARLVKAIPPARVDEIALSLDKNEAAGLDFFAVDAQESFQLWLANELGIFDRPFIVKSYRIINEEIAPDKEDGEDVCEVTIKFAVGDKEELFVSDGNGPVNALDLCFKKGLLELFPEEKEAGNIMIADYEAAVFNKDVGSGAKTQVAIIFSDEKKRWKTIGCQENILFASYQAIHDAYLYPFFLKQISSRLP